MKKIIASSILSTIFASGIALADQNINQTEIKDNTMSEYQSPSGFYLNASGGLAQTTSEYQSSGNVGAVPYDVDVKFPTQNQGAASLGFGYKWGFGQTNTFKNIFFGPSLNYYYFGKAVDPINSDVNDFTGQVESTEYTYLSGVDVEAFVGMYLASPFSIQVGLGVGGGVGGHQQGLLGVFNTKLAYDLSPNLRIYAEYISASFSSFGFAPLGFVNVVEDTNVSVNSEQIGIEYLF